MRRPGRTMASSPPCHGGCCGFESHPGRHKMAQYPSKDEVWTVNPVSLTGLERYQDAPPIFRGIG